MKHGKTRARAVREAAPAPYVASAPPPRGVPPERQLHAALTAFWTLADKWRLSAEEQCRMLAISDSTRQRWHTGRAPAFTPDLLDRLRFILLVYQHLHEIAGSEAGALTLLHAPGSAEHPEAPAQSVLDAMCTERLLDLQRIEHVLASVVFG